MIAQFAPAGTDASLWRYAVTYDVEDRISRVMEDVRPAITHSGREGLSQSLVARMERLCCPGASMSVIDGFDVARVRGFGIRTVGTAAAVTPATPFQAGSISKPVFALAVMRLVQEDILDLACSSSARMKARSFP
jgi:CubicO group peptidase (beta-lactamase class C family)